MPEKLKVIVIRYGGIRDRRQRGRFEPPQAELVAAAINPLRWICAILLILTFCVSTPIVAQDSDSPGNTVIFKDVTASAGIHFVHSRGLRSLEKTEVGLYPEDIGSGAAFADYDNDGDLDLYIVNNPGPLYMAITESSPGNVLYRNNGEGTFTDVTASAGIGDKGFGMGCVFGDYDNDGDLDLYVTNYGPNVMYRNNGDGIFTDVTTDAGVGDARWSTGAAFADYDNDGDLDLYVPNYIEYDLSKLAAVQEKSKQYGQYVPSALNPVVFAPQDNVLYRNNGNGTFTDVSADLRVKSEGGRSFQAIFTDFDLDGDLDLYIANDLSPNTLYRNTGNGTFTNVSDDSWAADVRGSMGLGVGDYDRDGDVDFFISHWMDQENALYSNLWQEESAIDNPTPKRRKESLSPVLVGPNGVRPIRLVDESYTAFLGEESIHYVGWGTDFFDYDNDGHLDIFVANGHTYPYLNQREKLVAQKDQLFRNNGDGVFTDTTEIAGIASLLPRVGRGVAFGDYDNDGDVDIVIINNHDRAVLLRNDGGNRNNWLHVKLTGTKRNRDAVGAKIRLKAGDLIQLREINAGISYLSFNSLIAEFGLGQHEIVDWLEVVWLSGNAERFTNIQANQRVVIIEGSGIQKR